MSTLSLTRDIWVICSLYPWYELCVHCIPYMSCNVHCTEFAFTSSLVTEQVNSTSPNHNIILSRTYLPATTKFSYSLPKNECDGAWYSVVPRFKFRAEDRLLWLRFLVIFFFFLTHHVHWKISHRRAPAVTCEVMYLRHLGILAMNNLLNQTINIVKNKTKSPTALV